MKSLPETVASYRRTPIFDTESIPAGLRQEHRTAPGVWGVITVLEGHLRYEIAGDPPEVLTLSPDRVGIIEPDVPHNVSADGPVRFYVEFHR